MTRFLSHQYVSQVEFWRVIYTEQMVCAAVTYTKPHITPTAAYFAPILHAIVLDKTHTTGQTGWLGQTGQLMNRQMCQLKDGWTNGSLTTLHSLLISCRLVTSAVPAWFPASRHDLLQTAGLRSCSAIASRTNPVLALRAWEVQCGSASSWPSACPYNAFAVHRENVCIPPIHCRKWPLVICYHPCTAHGQSSEVEP